MNLEHRTDIQSLYDFSSMCNDDLEIVAVFILMLRTTPTKKLLNDLESLNVGKYENDINYLLDNLKIKTIKNICEVMHDRKEIIYE